ncbi:unnamed protein product [Periconia digitata]|uniref:Copper-fist domain-containing protein n=1 Tax=Periconia digitata TaxID=1303443 RepID=A0A9W4XFV7_9PLEO|nr:unnamed protein product [Periconia digitata]
MSMDASLIRAVYDYICIVYRGRYGTCSLGVLGRAFGNRREANDVGMIHDCALGYVPTCTWSEETTHDSQPVASVWKHAKPKHRGKTYAQHAIARLAASGCERGGRGREGAAVSWCTHMDTHTTHTNAVRKHATRQKASHYYSAGAGGGGRFAGLVLSCILFHLPAKTVMHARTHARTHAHSGRAAPCGIVAIATTRVVTFSGPSPRRTLPPPSLFHHLPGNKTPNLPFWPLHLRSVRTRYGQHLTEPRATALNARLSLATATTVSGRTSGMPLIDGEKFACSSCIKGHRVSGCTHNDRELHHINPKGRPVKQCEHCRGARKSKSHHAKCDCGDKKDKDKVKDKADPNACCCHSGAKCICGGKKESVDLRLDTSKQTLHDMRARPKVVSTHSENNLTVFANGHHRPCHRNNISAHVSGAPYKIPRPHTLHGHSAFTSFTQGNAYPQVDAAAPRSMDTLSLSNNDFYQMFGSTSQAEALPISPLSGSLDTSCFQDLLLTGRSSTFGTGTQSPAESNLGEANGGSQWPLTSNPTSLNARNFGYGSLSTSPSQDCLPILGDDWPIPSAGLADHTSWTAGDLPLDSSKLGEDLLQPISHSGESKQSAPGLSVTSSSPSEVGEPTFLGEFDPRATTTTETLFWEDSPAFRPPPANANDSRLPTSIPPRSTPETHSLPDYSKTFNPVAAAMTSGDTNLYSETQSIAMPNNADDALAANDWLLNTADEFANYAATFDPSTFSEWL